MQVTIRREVFTGKSTSGRLLIDGKFFCFVLEDVDRELEKAPFAKIMHETAIPRGRYRLAVDWSPRFMQRMPHILDVPGFDGVRIHWGNKPEDTDGCPLLGDALLTDWISHSRATYAKFIVLLEDAIACGEDVWLEII